MDPQDDARLSAARYQIDKLSPAGEDDVDITGQTTMEARDRYVEVAVQQAIRRGDFDDLPGTGKPLENLRQIEDPNWWIRQKIQREKITGLGPPALTLRIENAALEARVDALTFEESVRELLEDFNHRVIEARRQLRGGPPVVTPTRDIEAEVTRWRERRAARRDAAEREHLTAATETAALPWRKRRRAKRD